MSGEIVAGTGAVTGNNSVIQKTLASMNLPSDEPVEAPVVTPRPEIPNVSSAKSAADNAIEIPNFEEIEEENAGVQEDGSEAPAVEETNLEEVQEGDEETKNPARENFKKLELSLKTERQAKKELEDKLKETSTKLERYEKGEVVPEIIRAKDERIAALEPYEKVVSLRTSPYYQQSFVEPSIEKRKELIQLGTEYNVHPDVMNRFAEIETTKELNSALTRYGFDPVAALKASTIIGDIHKIAEAAIEAEKEPVSAMEALKSQAAEHEQKEAEKRAMIFSNTVKESWGRSLEKTSKEGVFKEFIMHPTDSEWNTKVVEPIQHKAVTQLGALVKQLSKNGLKTLPPELADGLARMVLLSIGGASVLDKKEIAEKKADTLLRNTKRTTPYNRPSIGGSRGSSVSASKDQTPVNPKTAAQKMKF
jgi:hypothetical protein